MPRAKIVAVDFDGTIVDHAFPYIGDPISGAFEWLRRWQDIGVILILWTIRSDGEKGTPLTDAVEFCAVNGIDFNFVNERPQKWTSSPKVYAHAYIDDAAFGCPLLPEPGVNGRMMADWSVIGPGVSSELDLILKDVNDADAFA